MRAYTSSEAMDDNFAQNASFTGIQVQTAAIAYDKAGYQTDYGNNGFTMPLILGNYNGINTMGLNGISNIKSLRVAPCYKITVYSNNDYTGNAFTYTTDQADLSGITIQSLKVELVY